MGGGGLGNSGNARKKTFFFQLTPSLSDCQSESDLGGIRKSCDVYFIINHQENRRVRYVTFSSRCPTLVRQIEVWYYIEFNSIE